ncbi:hypothetical protein GOBAR_AA38993 [Gossypium barbadense]|uniref:Dephospho-CoA kinase n=1 Tax=Gossypium barbadense TaxID=3634 RepID=A0A2P5VSE5_GOSBA|nr:hypothetical protein GOBAR_AA38993 [Gossypium barbadense]
MGEVCSGIVLEILKLWIEGYKAIVLDIPLLFEAKMDKWTKPIVIVWVDPTMLKNGQPYCCYVLLNLFFCYCQKPNIPLRRLVGRDNSTEEDARNRINAQISLDSKRILAYIVIDNTRSLHDLQERFALDMD